MDKEASDSLEETIGKRKKNIEVDHDIRTQIDITSP